MKFMVCWFLAPTKDAAAIRSTVTTGERRIDEWPNLILPGVDGPDVNKLEKLARPKRPKGSSRLGGELLDKSKMTAEPFTAVSRVTPEFISALASLSEPDARNMGRNWSDAMEGG